MFSPAWEIIRFALDIIQVWETAILQCILKCSNEEESSSILHRAEGVLPI